MWLKNKLKLEKIVVTNISPLYLNKVGNYSQNSNNNLPDPKKKNSSCSPKNIFTNIYSPGIKKNANDILSNLDIIHSK